MPFPAEILTAVIDEPHNDAPREDAELWCQNNGQAERAKLIKMQLALEMLYYNPTHKAHELAFDVERLTEKHGQQWLQFDELDQFVSDYQYYRGFVELVQMSASDFLQHGEALFAKSPIRHLDLTDVEPHAEELFKSPLLKSIVSLSLKENNLSDSHMMQLGMSEYLGELRWLSLMLNQINLSGAEELAKSRGLDKLRYVNFYGNNVDPTENLVLDQGVVLESILPEAGKELEARNGPIRWLHHDEIQFESDLPPLRFTMA
jgi:hypothetical protein